MKSELIIHSNGLLVRNWIYRIGIITVIILGLLHYSENPFGINILIIICSLLFIFISDERIIVYEDCWEQSFLFLGGIIKRNKRFYFSDFTFIKIIEDNHRIEKLFNELFTDGGFSKFGYNIEMTNQDNSSKYINSKMSIANLR